MDQARGLLFIRRTGAAGDCVIEVVIELGAQADGLNVVVIIAIAGLVAEAGIEGFALAVEGIAEPDSIARALAWMLGEAASSGTEQKEQRLLHANSRARDCKGFVGTPSVFGAS